MNKPPKVEIMVDVIIPTYNGMPYLKTAVASVLAQTHTAFKLYIIDDGSTDQTAGYVGSLTDERIVYHHGRNIKVAAARNLGLKLSSSPLVAFLDADDSWSPQKLAKQVALMNQNPQLGFVYGGQQMMNEAGTIISTQPAKLRGRVFDQLLEGNKIIGSASMVLLRRDALQAVGDFKADFVMGEDWELWLRLAHDYEIDFVPEYLAQIRTVVGSSQTNFERNAKQLLHLAVEIKRDFKLSPSQIKQLDAHLYIIVAKNFYWAHDQVQARQYLQRAVRLLPSIVLRFDANTRSVGSRILLANGTTRKLKNLVKRRPANQKDAK